MDWLVIPRQLHVDAVAVEDGVITMLASRSSPGACCPACGSESSRLHGHDTRTMADLPWAGIPVRIRVTVRKFYCANPLCSRQIFAERMDEVAQRYSRRTDRQRDELVSLGLALGGEAGSRVAVEMGLPTSPDTVLRYIKCLPDVAVGDVRVLGIDDWRWRKRVSSGTILVNLERHKVVDLLPDREGESLVAWLKQHPEVEVITRDRNDTYKKAASEGAPQAAPVVDRWHILKHLVEYLEKVLLHHSQALKEAAPVLHGIQPVELPPAQRPHPREDDAQQVSEQRHAGYISRWKDAHRLREIGADIADIARTVGLSRTSVYRYLRMRDPPKRHVQQPRTTSIDPYKDSLVARWQEGCHDRRRLFSEIRAMGYRHSESTVFRFFRMLRRAGAGEFERVSGPSGASVRAPSAKHVATLLVRRPEALDENQSRYLAKMCELSDEIQRAYELTQDFCTMLRDLEGERLDAWVKAVEGSDSEDLQRFVLSIKNDYQAVKAGLTMSWSNGQTEGQVNRLKLVKRQGYGRAGFTLLRKRVLQAA